MEGRGYELVRHDLAKERPTRELLARLIDEKGLDAVLNKRSPTFKEMNLDLKTLTPAKAIDLMMKEPNLIKRPLVLKGSSAILGYAPEEYEKL